MPWKPSEEVAYRKVQLGQLRDVLREVGQAGVIPIEPVASELSGILDACLKGGPNAILQTFRRIHEFRCTWRRKHSASSFGLLGGDQALMLLKEIRDARVATVMPDVSPQIRALRDIHYACSTLNNEWGCGFHLALGISETIQNAWILTQSDGSLKRLDRAIVKMASIRKRSRSSYLEFDGDRIRRLVASLHEAWQEDHRQLAHAAAQNALFNGNPLNLTSVP